MLAEDKSLRVVGTLRAGVSGKISLAVQLHRITLGQGLSDDFRLCPLNRAHVALQLGVHFFQTLAALPKLPYFYDERGDGLMVDRVPWRGLFGLYAVRMAIESVSRLLTHLA